MNKLHKIASLRKLFLIMQRKANMIPEKLRSGDEVRIISLARSASDINKDVLNKSIAVLTDMGLKVTFSANAFSQKQRGCPADQEKVFDLHAAFKDRNVKCILAAIGGFNSNQLLDIIDWNLLREHPKIVAGFSDVTVLSHAILAKTGMVCYATPNLYCFGLPPESSYSVEYFKKCLFAGADLDYQIKSSDIFYDYPWNYDDESDRTPNPNGGIKVLQPGVATGTIIGGNMCSLNLLNGTEYFPKIDGDIILCIEDDSYDSIPETFERNFQSIIQQSYFKQIKAILFGRFQKESCATEQALADIIMSKDISNDIAMAYNLDFGHTDPKFTYPIGGNMSVDLNANQPQVRILKY